MSHFQCIIIGGLSVLALGRKKNSYVSAVPAGWNFFSAHPGAWEIHYSIFSFHTQIPLLFSALFTLTPAWLNSEVEISGKRNTQSPSISFWQHRIIGKTFFLCLWYDQINVSNTNDGVVSLCVTHQWVGAMGFHSSVETIARSCFFLHFSTTQAIFMCSCDDINICLLW